MIDKKRVKRILAGVLSICMVAGTLTGLNVPVEAAAGGPLVVTAGDAPVLKEGSYEYWNHTDWGTAADITFTQTTDFAGIGFRGGVVMDSTVVTGEQTKTGYCDVYLRPNVTVSNANDKFMMYTQMPTYNADSLGDNNWGELFRLSSIEITQGENTFSADFSENASTLSIQYLSESGNEWKSSTIEPTNSAFFNLGRTLSGFRGYLMFDFSQITWKADAEGAAFAEDAPYTVSRMTLRNSAVGGACGPFKVGGYYGIDTYNENATTLQFKNTTKVYTLNDAIKGNDYMKVTYNDGAGNMPEAFYQDCQGGCWGFSPGAGTGVDISQSNNGTVYGGYSYFVKFSSSAEQGYSSSSPTKNVSHSANVKVSTSSKGILTYLELPKTGQGYSSMKITEFVHGYANVNNTTYKYLTKDGENWVTGTVSADGELKFPDGFKGYVKLYPTIYNDFWKMSFNFGLFGGSYEDVIIGGFWSITEDSDSDYIQFTVDGKDTRQKIANVVLPLKGSMRNPQEPSNTVTVGAEVSAEVIGLEMGDGSIPTAKVTYSSHSEMFGTHLMRKVNSEAVVSDLNVYVKNLWANMDPDVNTFMLWMEVPTGAKISVNGPSLYQNKKDFWGDANGLQYSYLSKDATTWEYGVISEANNKIMELPDGFQGYVKFDVSTMAKYRNGWTTDDGTLLDYSASYQLNSIQFNFDKLGGECGPLVLGYVIPLTVDTNSLWAVISNSGTLTDGKPEALCMIAQGEQLLSELRGLLASIGKVTLDDYASVERAIELYQSLSEAQKALLTAEELQAYRSMISAFDKYRPSFKGVAAYVADGENMAGFRVGMQLDASVAQNDGYAASEYGTVVLPKAAFNPNNAKFDSTVAGALPYSYTNTSNITTITWDVDYTSKKWSEYDDNFYFRSYVTYTKGDNSITLWNGTVKNQASMSIDEYTPTSEEMKQLGTGFIKKVQFEAPYYVTSIVKAANLFGISVYAGHDYGNINGDYTCEWWGSTTKIDEEDTALLREYLVGSKSPSIRYMSDLDNDGVLSSKDLVRLKRYISDRNVVVGDQNHPELLELLRTTNKRDIYGDTAVNVVGDSISQGLNSGEMYDKSWVSIFKNALNDEMNSKDLGYVSLNALDNGNSEIHKLSYEEGTWAKWSFWQGTLGQCNYVNKTENATLTVTVDRQKDGVDRNINGFYLYYVGGTGGTFTVSVNDGTPVPINCNESQDGNFARSRYFDLSSVKGKDITIQIDATSAAETVKIAGISYRNKETGFVVNNYSLSGVALQCYSEDALKKIAQAPIVILTLGTNDVTPYYNTEIAVFQKQLDVLVKACKKNGSKLIVGDVIWNYQNNPRGFAFKQALKDAANAMGEDGYFVDFNDIPINKILDRDGNPCDYYHPSQAGHALMAQKMMNLFGLK